MMTPKELQAISQDLTMLYVEDDDNLRKETTKLFSRLFKSIDIAEDGAIGLEKFKSGSYDIVVTDINMPNMNGVQMVEAIKEIDSFQPIIITSAHDEAQYLLPLINAGVDKYILKPINMQSMIQVLATVCNNIQNQTLVDMYRKELEEQNETLVKANNKLEKLVRILDTKILNENFQSKVSKKEEASQAPLPTKEEDTLEDVTFETQIFDNYILDHDLAEIKELEDEIDNIAITLQLQHNPVKEDVVNLGELFRKYGAVLNTYPIFASLGTSIMNMGNTIFKEVDMFVEKAQEISSLLESFFYVLSKWRIAVFVEGINDPNMYDASLINDMETIIMILENTQEDIEGDIEFF